MEKKKYSWLIKYTIVFIVVSLITYSLQIFYGKSFIYAEEGLTGDGLVQHYNALAYYGNWLRTILKNIFVEHSFSIPEYDLSIGLGGDILTTLNYYALGDPLNLLSVFVPMRYTEVLYNLLVIVRLYLAGVTFYLYCLYHSYDSDRILPGAVIYVFSFYTIVISVLHPFFLNPLIYFPLILLGVDKVLKERKPLLFIISCAIAAVSNFYFFYMMTIFMVIYGMIRYVQYYGKEIRFMALMKELGRFAVSYVIALMLAAPIFIPSALAVLGSGRVGSGRSIPIIYELIYYIKLPIAFMNASADYYVALGYGAVAVLAVILLFFKTKWREKAGLKTVFVMGTVFLLFPVCGYVLNGFGYVVNRWIWAYCFVVSLIVVEMFPNILLLSKKMKWVMGGMTILFAIPTFYFRAAGNGEKLRFAVIVILIATAALILALLVVGKWKNSMAKACMVITVANIFLSMFSFYSPFSGADIKKHGTIGAAWENMTSGPFSVLGELGTNGMDTKDYETMRIDTSNLYFGGVRSNSAMLYDVNSVAFYYSVINGNTNKFLHDLWIPMPYENRYVDLDSRAMLSSFLGAGYNIVKTGEEEYLPYGYSHLIQENNGYSLYETENALPMAFMYDTVMEGEEYENLSAIRKQQSLLQAAAVENCDGMIQNSDWNLQKESPNTLQFLDTTSAYVIEKAEGVEVQGNRFEVKEAGASITLKADPSENTERYFAFANLYYEGKRTTEITITDGRRSKHFEVKSELDGAYADIHNFLCNLGYSEQHGTGYTIIFGEPGIYTYDSLEIINQPLEAMNVWITKRQETEVNYSFAEDRVILQANGDKAGLLYVSIPYSSGWKAMVDGESARIYKTNEFGIGIFLSPGEHSVELEYHAPYVRLGLSLLLLGIVGTVLMSRGEHGDGLKC